MNEPSSPPNEVLRQAAVDSLNILDTSAEDIFEHITELVAQIVNAPICLVALLDRDRNWLKSHYGIPFSESPRAISFCGHTINNDGPIMIVEDARIDERFHDNPLVTELGAVFYAGVPLVSSDGFRVGTICIYDKNARSLDEQETKLLINMGKQVEVLLESHKNSRLLRHTSQLLQQRNQELVEFARSVVHDLKSPISNIVTMADLVEAESEGGLPGNSQQWLNKLKLTSKTMATYVDDILNLYTDDRQLTDELETIELARFVEELHNLVSGSDEVNIILESRLKTITANRSVLMQIVMNLVSNSIKYCDKESVEIRFSVTELESFYEFALQDNGRGIPGWHIETLFELYDRGNLMEKETKQGKGIGLNRVKKLVQRGGGEVSVQSTVDVGTTFTFSIAKTV